MNDCRSSQICEDCDCSGELDDAMALLKKVMDYAYDSITDPNRKVVKIAYMIYEEYPELRVVTDE